MSTRVCHTGIPDVPVLRHIDHFLDICVHLDVFSTIWKFPEFPRRLSETRFNAPTFSTTFRINGEHVLRTSLTGM